MKKKISANLFESVMGTIRYGKMGVMSFVNGWEMCIPTVIHMKLVAAKCQFITMSQMAKHLYIRSKLFIAFEFNGENISRWHLSCALFESNENSCPNI